MAASPMRLLAGDTLVIVDLQCDFCSGGALPIAGAEEIVPIINDLIEEAIAAHALIVASRDWHPPDHWSFLGYGGGGPRIACKEASAPNFTLPCDCRTAHSSSARGKGSTRISIPPSMRRDWWRSYDVVTSSAS